MASFIILSDLFFVQVVLSVCVIVFLGTCLGQRQGVRQGQRTEESQANGQQRGGCSLFQGCLRFPSIPNPIDKFRFHVLNLETKKDFYLKTRSKVNFKVGKVRKVFGVKNAIFNLVPAKLQFEIDAIRGAQAFLDAKLAAK